MRLKASKGDTQAGSPESARPALGSGSTQPGVQPSVWTDPGQVRLGNLGDARVVGVYDIGDWSQAGLRD
jgi:hypothetical protein